MCYSARKITKRCSKNMVKLLKNIKHFDKSTQILHKNRKTCTFFCKKIFHIYASICEGKEKRKKSTIKPILSNQIQFDSQIHRYHILFCLFILFRLFPSLALSARHLSSSFLYCSRVALRYDGLSFLARVTHVCAKYTNLLLVIRYIPFSFVLFHFALLSAI